MPKPHHHSQIVIEDDDEQDDDEQDEEDEDEEDEDGDGDELEPLFDYGGVWQPPVEDDSDEDELALLDGKLWAQPADKHGIGNLEPKAILKSSHYDLQKGTHDVIEEDDWFPPPPKRSRCSKASVEDKRLVDPTILQLRQKRAELESLMGDSRMMKSDSAGKGETESDLDLSFPSPAAQRISKGEKVVVSVQNKDGVCKSFRICVGDKFFKLFKAYGESVGSEADALIFSFDGDQIHGDCTPKELGIEDEDIIEVDVRT